MKVDFNSYINNKKRSSDEKYMKVALEAAELSKSRGDKATGCCLVFSNSHISEGNSVLSEQNPLCHAEMNVLQKATTMSKNLKEAVMYSTIEPCAMCIAAMAECGVRELVFGVYDLQNGFLSSNKKLELENFDITYLGGILSEECYNMATPALRENLSK